MKGSVPLLIPSTLSGVIFFNKEKKKSESLFIERFTVLKLLLPMLGFLLLMILVFPPFVFQRTLSLHGIWMDEKGEKVKEVGTKQNLKPWLQQHQEKAKIGTNAGSSLVSPRE